MTTKRSIDRTILTVAVVGSLIFLNVLGLRHHARLDLTADRQFTLSSATVSTLRDLADPVTVRAYFTRDLPAPFSTLCTRPARGVLRQVERQAAL